MDAFGPSNPLFSGEFVKSLLSLKNQFSGISRESVQNLWVLTALLLISSVTLGESLQGLWQDHSSRFLQSHRLVRACALPAGVSDTGPVPLPSASD
jgi:membrane protein required for beta-lactamase induction